MNRPARIILPPAAMAGMALFMAGCGAGTPDEGAAAVDGGSDETRGAGLAGADASADAVISRDGADAAARVPDGRADSGRREPRDAQTAVDVGGWRSLFDGRSLAGWHAIGTARWTIEGGAIHGIHPADAPDYGYLVSDGDYEDFIVRLKFKIPSGDSGLYFRTEVGPGVTVFGYQANIEPHSGTGGLLELGGRNRTLTDWPSEADQKKWFKPDDWNEMVVSAIGHHILVTVNGVLISELPDDREGRTQGKLAVQMHWNSDVNIWLKDIEIDERSTGR